MANNIKGITVDIGGNVGPLASALQEVNTPISKLQSELKEVNRQLKFDPSNTTLLKQKQDLLAQSADALKEKQAILKKAVADAQAQFEKGDLGADKVRAVEREYQKVISQLKDTEKQLNSVQQTSGTVGEKIKATFAGMGQSIKSAFTMDNVKTALGDVGVAATGFLKGAIDTAVSAQQKTSQLTNLLQNQGLSAKQAGSDISVFTKTITDMSSFSAGEAKDALSALAQKGVSAGDALKDASTIANVAADRNISLADAANIVADAYNGKTKALTSLGILSKDEVKNLGDQENASISMADVQQRLNERFGGAAQKDLQTYSGQLKENENSLNSMRATIGAALLPVITQILKAVTPIIQTVAKFVTDHPKLTAAILAIVAVVGTLIGGLSLLTTVTGAFGNTLDVAVLPAIGLVVLAIAGIVAIVAVVIANWKPISGFFIGLWKDVVGAFNAAKNAVGNVLNGIAGFFRQWGVVILAVIAPFIGIPILIVQHWGQISAFFAGLWNGIKAGMSAAWNGINMVVMAVVTPLVQGVMNLWNSMKGGIQTVMNGLKNILGGIWTVIKNIVLGPVLLICDLVTGNFTKLHDDAVHIMQNIQNGLAQIWTGIQQVFNGALQAITGLVTTVWNGITSVTTTVWNAITSFLSGLWNAIVSTAQSIWNGLVSFFSSLPQNIYNIMVSIGTWIVNAWDNIISFVQSIPGKFMDGLSGLGNAVRSGFQDAINFITGLPAEALKWGGDIINGIVNGIKNAAGAVGKAVQGVAQDIRSFLHFSEPDVGPLVGFHGWWKDMMYGMAEDINSNIAPVADAARRVASTVAENIGAASSSALSSGYSPAVAMAGGGYYSNSVSTSTENSSSNNPMTVIFQGNDFGNQQTSDANVNKISNAIAQMIDRKR